MPEAEWSPASRTADPDRGAPTGELSSVSFTLGGISLARVRQVIDVPPPLAVEVRGHRIYKGWCAGCGKGMKLPLT